MRTKMLNINDFDVTRKPVLYTCYGLGSCIGLFVSDRIKKLSGGAHIPLPYSSTEGEFQDAIRIICSLLNSFASFGSDLNTLRAKITGGSHVYENLVNIGEANARVVVQQLTERKIFIAATDLGGSVSRTARFNSLTGELKISTSEQKTYWI